MIRKILFVPMVITGVGMALVIFSPIGDVTTWIDRIQLIHKIQLAEIALLVGYLIIKEVE